MRSLRLPNILIVTKIVFTNEATNALISQALYIFRQSKNIEIADRYLDDMKEFIISTLSLFPKAGRPVESFGKGVRKLVYQQYSILYIAQYNRIVILTIFRENLPDI